MDVICRNHCQEKKVQLMESEGKYTKRHIPIVHGIFYIFYTIASVYAFFRVLNSNPARRNNKFEIFFDALYLFAVIVFTAASYLKFSVL